MNKKWIVATLVLITAGTAVLEQQNGRWQIVHWHSSASRRTPAAAVSQ